MTEFSIARAYLGGDAPIFFIVDHASFDMPAQFDQLGLPDDVLATHIGWDIGAAALTEALIDQLGGQGLMCGYSRLLIDPNRSLDKPDLVPPTADRIPIPGNEGLSPQARHERIARFHQPYHERLDLALDQVCRAHAQPLIVSIHSFTPRLLGDAQLRPWHIGLLWHHDAATAGRLLQDLTEQTALTVGDNQPYDGRKYNYTMDRHVAPRGVRHITLEIRQDLVAEAAGVTAMTADLAPILAQLMQPAP